MEKTIQQEKALTALQNEAKRLKKEFEEYLEDLELFSKPEFWTAVKESSRVHKDINAYSKKMGV